MTQNCSISEIRFAAVPQKGPVTAILMRPDRARHLIVLGHGASSNSKTPLMSSIAEALAAAGIATLRYNFPYSEYGTGRDSTDVCVSTIRSAVAAAREHAPDLALLAGGQSFGGRMTSTAQSIEALEGVKGLVFFGFPLHLPDKPATKRAEHLKQINIPMLFLTGTRDKLADLDLIKGVVKDLGPLATLHLVDTADHGFHVLKRSRATSEDVFSELGHSVREWVTKRSL